ncbi:hypothetical protein Pcinc_023921 [Petrolisthes cinctipes]|uniref:Uncharacterized protein n=1 Tax=Petrolisthes cinctipes TaxID=88211 RepID=A0AAE1KG30_PETCI|nr:hypothetical protein Pcinc_023921 [Petrolisthes cinctipes]
MPESEDGHAKVLHRSNLLPWNPPESEEAQCEGESHDGEEKEGLTGTPDMAEAMKKFGFSSPLSSVREETEGLETVSLEEEELVEKGEDSSRKARKEAREAARLRRSRQIAEWQQTDNMHCIGCQGCVHEGTHKENKGRM